MRTFVASKKKETVHQVHKLFYFYGDSWGCLCAGPCPVANEQPNILVIWGDDIGLWNISHNNCGMMGYETPNIDRIANEGVSFTDYYGQQSCTAGQAAFIGGNVPSNGHDKGCLPGAKKDGRRLM